MSFLEYFCRVSKRYLCVCRPSNDHGATAEWGCFRDVAALAQERVAAEDGDVFGHQFHCFLAGLTRGLPPYVEHLSRLQRLAHGLFFTSPFGDVPGSGSSLGCFFGGVGGHFHKRGCILTYCYKTKIPALVPASK